MKRRTKTAAALLLAMTLTAGAIPVQNSMGSFLTGITASAAQEKAIGSKVYWQVGDTIGEKQYRFSAYTWVSRVLNSADSGEKNQLMAKALYGYVKAAEELAGIPVQSVKITNAPTAAVTRGDTLTASVFPEDASDKTVTWESSNSSSLFFHDHGSFSIKHDGTVTVTAKAGGKSDSCSIKVQIPTVPDEEIWTVPNSDVPL